MSPSMLADIPASAWRPELPGWSDDILPYYKQIAEALPHDAKIVEVGVAHGRSSVFLAEQLLRLGKTNVELYCVDAWSGASEFGSFLRTIGPDYDDGDRIVSGRATFDEMAMMRVLRVDGVRAARLFDDLSLDFVFIDSDHSYESVKAHLFAWEDKVKFGGIIAGHDYHPRDWPGVVRAVDEFFGQAVDRPTRTVWAYTRIYSWEYET